MVDPHFLADGPEAVGLDPDRVQDLFERAEREIREGLLPSCQLAIAREGRIGAMASLGRVTRMGVESAASDDTLYTIFSCTKAIVSSAIWILLQEGKLDLDERVGDIVPEFASNGKEGIRVEQLLIHTAGFPHAPFPPLLWNDRAARLERFGRWRLNWQPGSQFEYHPSSGMWMLAEILERRSGMDFRRFFRSRIALPLGLPELHVGLVGEAESRVADLVHVGEEPSAEELRALGFPAMPVTEVTEEALERFNRSDFRDLGVPGGGGITSAADLALFYQALLHGGRAHDGTQVWSAEILREARRVRTGKLTDPYTGKLAHRGLGISIAGDDDRHWRGFGKPNSAEAFGHNGAGGQIAWADPATGISFAYCTSGFDRHPLRLARRSVGLASRAALCVAGAG